MAEVDSSLEAFRARDFQKEESNRAIVIKFYEQVFIDHDVDGGVVVLAEDYIQHNPLVPNGKQGFVSFFKQIFAQQPNVRARIMRVAADGDLVWVNAQFAGPSEDRGFQVVDMFRIENGMLVEHWDVMQDVPEAAIKTM